MEWNEKLQLIIEEVEEHLQRTEEPVNMDQIAKIAGCSFAFFQKVFAYMYHISFSEYIRSRKLTLAGYDLKSTNLKVVEISYKYGYDSPTSFTKAFQKFHGVTPTEARNHDVKLNVVPKLSLAPTEPSHWHLEKKPSRRLIGKTMKVAYDEEVSNCIPALWSSTQRDGSFAKLVTLDEGNPKGMLGIFQEDLEKKERSYSLMVFSEQELPEGFQEMYLPEETWAVFQCTGAMPYGIQKGWAFLQEEWLDRYPFRHAACPEIEWYSSGNPYEEDYSSQIWIPIIEEG